MPRSVSRVVRAALRPGLRSLARAGLACVLSATPVGAQPAPDSSCVAIAAAPVLGQPFHRIERTEVLRGGPRRGRGGLQSAADLADALCRPRARLAPTPLQLTTMHNSAWAADRYDGALWAGRGWSGAWSGGATVRWGLLRAVLAPEVTWQENAPFRIAPGALGHTEYSYGWITNIDWPQRFGAASFGEVRPGASRVSLEWRGAGLGLSTENVWMGPALRYPLLLSNTAEGFPHLFIQSPAWKTPIGALELSALLGRLRESPYFDADPANDLRSLSVLSLVLRPTPGLALGSALLNHRASGTVPPLRDLLAPLKGPFAFVNKVDLQDENGLASVFAQWDFPASGIGVYGEWGREDFFYDLQDLATDPSFSNAWTLGLTKRGRLGPGEALVTLELTNLSDGAAWYTNSDVPQGHTNRGQLLGAWIGPGSEAQFASLDWTRGGRERWTLELERVRFDEVSFRNRFFDRYSYRGHDVELRASVGHGRRVGPLLLEGTAGMAWRRNRSFLDLDLWTFAWDRNAELSASAAWIPGQRP